jgi:hypothetical protein
MTSRSEGTQCYDGLHPHKEWRGFRLPIKVLTSAYHPGRRPKAVFYDGHPLFVLPGGQAVYFPNGVTPVLHEPETG